MKNNDKGENVTLQTPDGARFPGKRKDDGIKTTCTAKYSDTIIAGWKDLTDPERVEALATYRSSPGDALFSEAPDPLATDMQDAARYLKVAHENADIEKARAEAVGEDPSPDILADKRHASRLHYELDRLREALDGGDVRHAARAGIAFGKALEEMRVRLEATSVKAARKSVKGGKDGAIKAAATRIEGTKGGYAEYRRLYDDLKKTRPNQSPDQLFQYIADTHGERVSERYGCGAKKGTVRTAVNGRK